MCNIILYLFWVIQLSHSLLLDYSKSHYIPISDENVAIFNGHQFLTHTTNLTDYEATVEETTTFLRFFPQSPMTKLLRADLEEIKRLLDTLRTHHRRARSINFLGTALKIVAGTPDFDDFNDLKNKQNGLVLAHERQITINTQLQRQINNLTDAVNTLVAHTKETEMDTGNLFEILNGRNKAIITQLSEIALTIALSKLDSINPSILDSADIEDIIKTEKCSDVSVSDIISNSKIRVMQNTELLIFLIKYPIIETFCNKTLIYPVIHNNSKPLFESHIVAKCDNSFKMLKNCKQAATIAFCELETDSRSSCLHQILNNYSANCTTAAAYEYPALTLVDEGAIILNDNIAEVVESGKPQTVLRGTYLILFDDEVRINGTTYQNHKRVTRLSPQTPIAHAINITGHMEVLSLPYLHQLNVRNLEHIGTMKNEMRNRSTLGLTILLTLGVMLIIALSTMELRKRLAKKKRVRDIQVLVKAAEDGLSLRGGVVNTTVPKRAELASGAHPLQVLA